MASLKVGETLQLPPAEKYTTSNSAVATVSKTGLVTAVAEGSATVRGVTVVSVVAADPAPTPEPAPEPVPIPSGESNEPLGMTMLGERAMAHRNEDPAWDDSESFTFTTDNGVPVARAVYPKGFRGGVAAGMTEFAGFGTKWREMYARYGIKYSPNYYGHDQSGNNKNAFAYSNAFVASLVFENICSGNGPMVPMFIGQDLIVPRSGEYERWLPNVAPDARYVRGQRHLQEWHVVGNTAGNADGSIRWWLDGVLVGEYTRLQFNPGATFWTTFKLTSVYGGGSDGVVPADQYVEFDHVYVSGKH